MVKEFVNGGRAVLETFIHSLINMINEFKFFLEHARRCSQNKKSAKFRFFVLKERRESIQKLNFFIP